MSASVRAGVEPIRCDAPGCDWHIECPFPSNEEHRFNLDALAGHQRRVHIEEASRNGAKLDDVMSIECPFKEESMRAAFYVGWLAARR